MQRMAWTDERLEERFARIDDRFDEVDRRFDAVDRRFDAVDRRFDGIERQLVELRQGLAALGARIDRISIALLIGFLSLATALVVQG